VTDLGSENDWGAARTIERMLWQFLFASQVVLGRLNRCMAKQELNLFKFSPSHVAEPCA
jgi:hypothetical protein